MAIRQARRQHSSTVCMGMATRWNLLPARRLQVLDAPQRPQEEQQRQQTPASADQHYGVQASAWTQGAGRTSHGVRGPSPGEGLAQIGDAREEGDDTRRGVLRARSNARAEGKLQHKDHRAHERADLRKHHVTPLQRRVLNCLLGTAAPPEVKERQDTQHSAQHPGTYQRSQRPLALRQTPGERGGCEHDGHHVDVVLREELRREAQVLVAEAQERGVSVHGRQGHENDDPQPEVRRVTHQPPEGAHDTRDAAGLGLPFRGLLSGGTAP
mmetsp:Transcript_82499/g.246015  ORF Transcript_82499/g.246015 Transcript_82499/m.246015 type:complete len:269 (-) Transcript_82499:655-1461(-)